MSNDLSKKKNPLHCIWEKMNKRIGEIWVEKSFGMQDEIEK